MMLRAIRFVAMVWISSSVASASVPEQEMAGSIEYRGWLVDTTVTFYLPNDGETDSLVKHARDATSTSYFCPEDSDYFCINSFTFTFAIPRCLGPTQIFWEFGERTYRIVDSQEEVKIFDRKHESLFLIETSTSLVSEDPNDMSNLLVLFSLESGVVGYARDILDGPTPTFWLADELGLAASIVEKSNCN